MNAQSDALLYLNALPRLEIEGEEDVMAARLLQSLEMTESEGGMSSIELGFLNAATVEGSGAEMPFETGANDRLTLGRAIRVVTGPTHDPQEVFQGTITGIELVMDGASPPQLIVLAEDALQSLRLQRRTKFHEAGTLGDLVDAVARESGLSVTAADLSQFELGGEMQANETDLGFLRRVCGRFDVDFQIVGDALQVSPRAAVDRGTRRHEFGETLTAFRGLADLADQVTGVTMSGWDHAASRAFSVTSGAGVQVGAGSGRMGHELYHENSLTRSAHVAEQPAATEAEAQIVADALHAARARRFVSAEGTVTGDPSLRVGCLIEIAGVGPRFENTYYVTHAQHRFSRAEGGYQTDFRAECAYWRG